MVRIAIGLTLLALARVAPTNLVLALLLLGLALTVWGVVAEWKEPA
jgi:hypothetical protein